MIENEYLYDSLQKFVNTNEIVKISRLYTNQVSHFVMLILVKKVIESLPQWQ